jgi:hypothetical protein
VTTNLEALQQTLEQALRGERATDDRELATVVREEGHRLVFLLSGLVRASRLYDLENAALTGPSRELAEVLDGLVDRLGVVHVVLVEGQAYVNDVRVRVRALEQDVVDQLAGELGRHEVGGLSFHQRLEAGALKQLAQAVSRAAEAPAPRSALRMRLSALGNVGISGRWRFRLQEEEATPARAQAELAWRVVETVRDALGRLAAGWTPNPLPLRRVVISVIDAMAGDSGTAQAALAPFAGRPGSSERHLISVCQLSLLLGRSIGLPETTLSDLGVAALLHDVGYLSGRDGKPHALEGARLLVRQRGFSEAKVHRLCCVLEHHPDERAATRAGSDAPSLFARILHVADEYDLLVAPRLSGGPSLAPATALARMWARRGTRYDPALLAAFARELGLYPPGTALELSDGSLAVVIRPARDRARWREPVVRVVRPAAAAGEAAQELDLHVPGGPSVSRVLEPAAVGEGLVVTACHEALAFG